MEKYDLQSIHLISFFEKITRAHVKKFFTDKRGQLVFIVKEGQAGKAIGKSGMNIRKLRYLLKKRVRVVEFNPDPKEFIKNFIAPIEVDAVTQENSRIILSSKDTKTRGMLIGREKQNLKEINAVMQKLFKVEVVIA